MHDLVDAIASAVQTLQPGTEQDAVTLFRLTRALQDLSETGWHRAIDQNHDAYIAIARLLG